MSLETGDKNSAHNHKKLIGKNESLNQVIELNDENWVKIEWLMCNLMRFPGQHLAEWEKYDVLPATAYIRWVYGNWWSRG